MREAITTTRERQRFMVVAIGLFWLVLKNYDCWMMEKNKKYLLVKNFFVFCFLFFVFCFVFCFLLFHERRYLR